MKICFARIQLGRSHETRFVGIPTHDTLQLVAHLWRAKSMLISAMLKLLMVRLLDMPRRYCAYEFHLMIKHCSNTHTMNMIKQYWTTGSVHDVFIQTEPILQYCLCTTDHLFMRSANERRRYIVTSSLIGWAHKQMIPVLQIHGHSFVAIKVNEVKHHNFIFMHSNISP